MLSKEYLTNEQYKNIALAVWSIACHNQKAQIQLRHWNIDKYFEKPYDKLACDNETLNIMKYTYEVLKN